MRRISLLSPLFPYTTLFRSAWIGSVISLPTKRHIRLFALPAGIRSLATPPLPRELARPDSVSTRTISHSLSRTTGESARSEEHTSELQSLTNLVCRLLLEKK